MEIINQPLLTEEGFVNEACLNELTAAIKNMPETWERLANEPEWNTPRLTHFREITGALAYWAVKQFCGEDIHEVSPPAHAPQMESVISFLTACIRPKFDKFGVASLSLCDINKMCWHVLGDMKTFQGWNTKEVLGEYWLDLSALLHNVCLTIRNDRREFDRFNEDFERSGC